MAEHGALAQRIHREATRVSLAAGLMTSGRRVLPDFLIAGTQRGGTTALYKTLVQHPDVLPAGLSKGVHYFDTNYQKGLSWYRAHFPTMQTMRARESKSGRTPLTGEGSPYYMFHPEVPGRIAKDLPGVKVIVALRDPVERAYSAYTHERARGFETEASFEAALALEEQRLEGEHLMLKSDESYVSRTHQHNAYLARGRYIEQLLRMESAIGRDNLIVIDSDDLFVDFEPAFASVLEFLQLRQWLPEGFKQRNARPRSSLDPGLRSRLLEQFELYDERLEAWWGRKPSWRR